MTPSLVKRWSSLSCLLWLVPTFLVAQGTPQPIGYTLEFGRAAENQISVTVHLPPGSAQRDLQLPVWNATYQVRDFVQYVRSVHAQRDGHPLPVQLLQKSRWRISGAEDGADVEYEVVANTPGPYGAEYSEHHAFLNLAEVLMYPIASRADPVRLVLRGLAANWKVATSLSGDSTSGFSAGNYDELVDAPIEAGEFKEADFLLKQTSFRVVLDGNAPGLDIAEIARVARAVAETESAWMDDMPMRAYLFIYHVVANTSESGGMEHAFSCAIDLSPDQLAAHSNALAQVTAHEFFHLWNVKRIRPSSLEPVDYTQEQYTPSLWFSEGVTSTVQDYALLLSGLENEKTFLNRLSARITDLEDAPAYQTQSAEESSISAWLEKYDAYNSPARSISYYTKGEVLGICLDLYIRRLTNDSKSLRDLFREMNVSYAKKRQFFPDSAGIEEAASRIAGSDLQPFFTNYVSGVVPIPWDDFLNYVGLRVVQNSVMTSDPGVQVDIRKPGTVVVASIDSSEALKNGLKVGDEILQVNGTPAAQWDTVVAGLRPSESLTVKVRRGSDNLRVKWNSIAHEAVKYQVVDTAPLSHEQFTRRYAWLHGGANAEAAIP